MVYGRKEGRWIISKVMILLRRCSKSTTYGTKSVIKELLVKLFIHSYSAIAMHGIESTTYFCRVIKTKCLKELLERKSNFETVGIKI